MSTPEHTFVWYECATTDAAAAKGFYGELFGWNVVDVAMPGDMEGHYTLLKIGEDDIAGLYQMSGPQFEGVPPHWMTYVKVNDVDETTSRADSLEGKTVVPAMDVPGIGRMAVLEDPTGAKFSIFKPGEHSGAAELGPVAGTFGWSELATNDTEAAASFYKQLFNWGTKVDEKMQYTEFQVDERSIGGMMKLTPEHGDAPPHWLPYVMVDDSKAIADKVGKLGGTVIVPPTDIPKVGTFTVFADPTGAVLAVIKLAG